MTLSTYYGLTREEIVRFVNEDHPQGVDRFVPLGKSMDLSVFASSQETIRGGYRMYGYQYAYHKTS